MMCQSINQSFIDSNENKVVSNVPRTGETKQFSKTKKLKSVTFTISMNDGIPLANQPSNTCVYWRHPNLNDIIHMKIKKKIEPTRCIPSIKQCCSLQCEARKTRDWYIRSRNNLDRIFLHGFREIANKANEI